MELILFLTSFCSIRKYVCKIIRKEKRNDKKSKSEKYFKKEQSSKMETDTDELEYSNQFSSCSDEPTCEFKDKEWDRFETQELQYSDDRSLSCTSKNNYEGTASDESYQNESSSEETSTDDSFPDALKPFAFEPMCSPRKTYEVSSSESSSGDEENIENQRKYNTKWCLCNKCMPMNAEVESLCCRDTNDIPDNYFQGYNCVTESEDFQTVCLSEPVLKTAISAINHYKNESLELNERSFRFAAYKQYIFWIYNYLGKGIRKVIPSCVVWKIRDKFKLDDEVFVPFKESELLEKLAD